MPRFTDKYIENLKCPLDIKADYIQKADRGLCIRVYKDQTKTWHYRYNIGKSQKLMHIGDYPTMTLAAARKRVGELREQKNKGGDPATEYKEARTKRATASTVKDLTDAYLIAKAGKTSIGIDKEYIDREILPKLEKGKKLVTEVTKSDLNKIVVDINNRKKPAASNRCQAVIKAVFQYAVDADPPFLEINPALTIKKVGEEKSRTRQLSVTEIKYLWNKLTETNSNLIMSHEIKRALMLTLLTGQRPGEVIGMHSREISNKNDLGYWFWTIPEERVKNERVQRVYLTPLALRLIGNKEGYIFESDKGGKPIKQTAMSHAVKRNLTGSFDWQRAKKASTKAKLKEKKGTPLLEMDSWTPHDLRRTAATMLKEIGYDKKSDIDMILNHIRPEDRMANIYIIDNNDINIKCMLEAWNNVLEQIVSGEITGADIARYKEERALARQPNFAEIKRRWASQPEREAVK